MRKIFKSKKAVVIAAVCILLVALILMNVVFSMFMSLSVFKKDGWSSFEEYLYGEQLKADSQWISENGEKFQIDNKDGDKLTAISIKNEHVSHSYAVICHQYGGSPETMTEYAKHFYELGFNIIMPYMRGHGESSYNSITFGWKDKQDISDWVDAVVKQDKSAKIVLFGVSLGANAVALAAAQDLPDNVRMVISDSCYTALSDLIKEYIKNETEFSSVASTELISAFAEKKIGEKLKNADTIACLDSIELPIMFINGENDSAVPPLVSKKLYENCDAEGVEEVIIENGVHGRNLQADKQAYWSNVDAFILNNLGI